MRYSGRLGHDVARLIYLRELLLQLLDQVEDLLLRRRTCLALLTTPLDLLELLVVEADALPQSLLVRLHAEV